MQVFFSRFFEFLRKLATSGENPRCSDVEIIALSLFQEFLSIDSACMFFDTMQSLLPDLALRMGSRRNYNARRHHLAYHIEQIRARIIKSIPDDESGSIRLIDSMPIEVCKQRVVVY